MPICNIVIRTEKSIKKTKIIYLKSKFVFLLWYLLLQCMQCSIILDFSHSLSYDLAMYKYDIIPWDIAVHISTMQGFPICCHEDFVIVSNINNRVMTTPAENNGHDDVTELPVTSQWFGIL